MWKFIFSVDDVIFKFQSLKRKTHKIQMNNAWCKTLKNIFFGTKNLKNKLQPIWTYENMVKF
jgi:hypothetical protein